MNHMYIQYSQAKDIMMGMAGSRPLPLRRSVGIHCSRTFLDTICNVKSCNLVHFWPEMVRYAVHNALFKCANIVNVRCSTTHQSDETAEDGR